MNSAYKTLTTTDLRSYILDFIPKTIYVNEGNAPIDYIDSARVNDYLYYITNNQLGCIKFKILLDTESNSKFLHPIWFAEEDY